MFLEHGACQMRNPPGGLKRPNMPVGFAEVVNINPD